MAFFLTTVFISHSLLWPPRSSSLATPSAFAHASYLLASLRMSLESLPIFRVNFRYFLQDFPNPFSYVQSLPIQHFLGVPLPAIIFTQTLGCVKGFFFLLNSVCYDNKRSPNLCLNQPCIFLYFFKFYFIMARTPNMRPTLLTYCVQYCIVNYRHSVVQLISRTYSSCLTET